MRVEPGGPHSPLSSGSPQLGKAYGVESHVLSPAETKALYPLMNVDDLYGTLYVPQDGTMDPAGTCTTLVRAAAARGAQVPTAAGSGAPAPSLPLQAHPSCLRTPGSPLPTVPPLRAFRPTPTQGKLCPEWPPLPSVLPCCTSKSIQHSFLRSSSSSVSIPHIHIERLKEASKWEGRSEIAPGCPGSVLWGPMSHQKPGAPC